MFRKSRLIPLLFALFTACSQAPIHDIPALNPTGDLTAVAVPPRGDHPAHIRWSGGNLTLKGCAWQGFDQKDSAFRSLYIETSRSPGHLVLYDRGHDRYLLLPQRGGQAYWRKSSSRIWLPFRKVEPFALPPQRVTYQDFSGVDRERLLCPGRYVALLLAPRSAKDLLATARVVPAVDAAYKVYRTFTSREPQLYNLHYDRAPVAEVPDGATCGAGCGYIGFTGIEVISSFVDIQLDEARTRNEQYHLPFYELGRNFWFYGDQLGAIDAFIGGFAIGGQFISMNEANIQGAPFRDIPFDTFREAVVDELLQTFLEDDSLTWRNTLVANQAPPNAYGLNAADLAAALYWRIYKDHGLSGYRRFFSKLSARPYASTPRQAVTNFVAAAYAAVGEDYRYIFKDNKLRLR